MATLSTHRADIAGGPFVSSDDQHQACPFCRADPLRWHVDLEPAAMAAHAKQHSEAAWSWAIDCMRVEIRQSMETHHRRVAECNRWIEQLQRWKAEAAS